ncbi:hypothetical protein CRYPA_1595 [uncultured Candidatus Thioglobus sp.]|nr:hypothetical protein CRYPA_1595 [uncultured Candidatus Thioglobus sp.]
MTLYLKKIEKEYKDGRPTGAWTKWYENGKIWGVIDFETTTLSDYEPHSSIVKIDMRYSDEDNSIRYKGEAFSSKLIRIKDNGGKGYKIGITNRTVAERFAGETDKLEVVKTWYYESGKDARDKEREVLIEFKPMKYIGEPLLSSGNTEIFSQDVLMLDKA